MTNRGDTALYRGLIAGLATLFVVSLLVSLIAIGYGIEPGPWMTSMYAAAALVGSCVGLHTLRRKPTVAPAASASTSHHSVSITAATIIARCPECDYDQRSLPDVHRCPECGFEFDEHTRVWRPTRPWKAYAGLLGIQVFLFYMLASPIAHVLALVVGQALAAVLSLGLLLGVPLATIALIYASNRRGRYVAVTPTGVRARTLSGTFSVPWSEISTVAVFDSPPSIQRRGVNFPISLRGIFDDKAAAAAFASAVQAARMRYATTMEARAHGAGLPSRDIRPSPAEAG